MKRSTYRGLQNQQTVIEKTLGYVNGEKNVWRSDHLDSKILCQQRQ